MVINVNNDVTISHRKAVVYKLFQPRATNRILKTIGATQLKIKSSYMH